MNRSTASTAGWRKRLIGASAVGAVAAAVSLAGAPGAFATNDYLEFSLDGTTYAPSIRGPIFTEALQFVPGATTDASIWIRNSSGEPARLSSAAIMVRSDPQLNRQLGLTAGPASSLPDRSPLGGQGSCTDIPGVWDMGSGEQLELSLVVDLSTEAPNDTMNRAAHFDLVFLLESQDAAPRHACDALGGPKQPSEPGTVSGSPAPAETVMASSQLVSLPGTMGNRPAAESNPIFPAALPERQTDVRRVQGMDHIEQQLPAEIIPAGFQSTVEPIVRSVSGTLLIAVSVLFAAAVVFRVREGRYE